MRRETALRLGVRRETLDDVEVDISRVVVSEEFRSKAPGKYRERAIDRLVAMGCGWRSEENITFEVVKRFVRIICPYCGEQLSGKGGGGNASESHINFDCACGATAGLTVPATGGLSFGPPPKKTGA